MEFPGPVIGAVGQAGESAVLVAPVIYLGHAQARQFRPQNSIDLTAREDKEGLNGIGLSFAATARLHIDHDINREGHYA